MFRKSLRQAMPLRDTEAVMIEVTEENNGYACFLLGHPAHGPVLIKHDNYDKHGLIEWAVADALKHELVMEAMALSDNAGANKPEKF